METIKKYLEDNNKKIGVLCSFDSNGNEYDHKFFLCDDGKSDQTAWDLEIRKMEDVTVWQDNIEDAEKIGLKTLHDFYNYHT